MGYNSGFKGLMHGMAGERHGHGMLCVNPPLLSVELNSACSSCYTYPTC